MPKSASFKLLTGHLTLVVAKLQPKNEN